MERLAHTNPVGQLPGPLSYKLLDQFTMPMLPTEPQCTNVIACIRYSNNMPVVTV